jgi:hypothetical protein
LWDGGNVAYYDSMKTVLTTEEFASCFPATPSAEHFGDMFEFWLGMLDLAVQFPPCSLVGATGQLLGRTGRILLAIPKLMQTLRDSEYQEEEIEKTNCPTNRAHAGEQSPTGWMFMVI